MFKKAGKNTDVVDVSTNSSGANNTQKAKTKFYKKKWFWVLIAALLILSFFGGNGNDEKNNNPSEPVNVEEQQSETEAAAESTEQPEETPEENNETGEETTVEVEENLAEKYASDIVVAAKMALDNFIADYDISLAPQKWTLAKFDEKGAYIGITDITYKSEKMKYIYVGTLNIDDSGKVTSAKPHHLEINGTVLGDDGYCDEVFDKIKELSGN